jgi:hypothetical protein
VTIVHRLVLAGQQRGVDTLVAPPLFFVNPVHGPTILLYI